MTALSLGQFRVEAVPDGIRIRIAGTDLKPMHLGIDQARKLEQFLRDQNLAERRLGFRVPLHAMEAEESQLHCEVEHPSGGLSPATAVDLSLTGILVEVPELPVAEGQTLKLELTLGRTHASLSARIVRSQAPLLALHFIESLKDGELDPPEALASIYRELEARWLRKRIVTGSEL